MIVDHKNTFNYMYKYIFNLQSLILNGSSQESQKEYCCITCKNLGASFKLWESRIYFGICNCVKLLFLCVASEPPEPYSWICYTYTVHEQNCYNSLQHWLLLQFTNHQSWKVWRNNTLTLMDFVRIAGYKYKTLPNQKSQNQIKAH